MVWPIESNSTSSTPGTLNRRFAVRFSGAVTRKTRLVVAQRVLNRAAEHDAGSTCRTSAPPCTRTISLDFGLRGAAARAQRGPK